MRLRNLLTQACETLETYGTLSSAPRSVGKWWRAKKNLEAIRKDETIDPGPGELQKLLESVPESDPNPEDDW